METALETKTRVHWGSLAQCPSPEVIDLSVDRLRDEGGEDGAQDDTTSAVTKIDCHQLPPEVSKMPNKNVQAVWPPLFAQSAWAGSSTTN